MRQEVQRTPLCLGVSASVPCVENRRWTVGRVTYVTLNVQGSCNNLCDVAPDPAEYAARNAANVAWMQETFDRAKRRGSVAVMLISQADPGWDGSDATRAPTRDPKTLARESTSPSRTPRAAASRTSRVSRRSATTRRTPTTTRTGSRCSSTRAAARSSRTNRRSCRPTAPPSPPPDGRSFAAQVASSEVTSMSASTAWIAPSGAIRYTVCSCRNAWSPLKPSAAAASSVPPTR